MKKKSYILETCKPLILYLHTIFSFSLISLMSLTAQCIQLYRHPRSHHGTFAPMFQTHPPYSSSSVCFRLLTLRLLHTILNEAFFLKQEQWGSNQWLWKVSYILFLSNEDEQQTSSIGAADRARLHANYLTPLYTFTRVISYTSARLQTNS